MWLYICECVNCTIGIPHNWPGKRQSIWTARKQIPKVDADTKGWSCKSSDSENCKMDFFFKFSIYFVTVAVVNKQTAV